MLSWGFCGVFYKGVVNKKIKKSLRDHTKCDHKKRQLIKNYKNKSARKSEKWAHGKNKKLRSILKRSFGHKKLHWIKSSRDLDLKTNSILKPHLDLYRKNLLEIQKVHQHKENEVGFLSLIFRKVTAIKIIANLFFTHHTLTYLQDQRFDHIGRFLKNW